MNVKDKIIFGLIVVLLVGGGYIYYTYTQIIDTMDLLASQDAFTNASVENPLIDTHVTDVNTDFEERLEKLRLQFIGRAKHVRNNKLGIEANTELIEYNTDSLSTRISDVQFNLDEFARVTERDLKNLERDIEDAQASFDNYRRRTSRKISDIEQTVTSVQNDVTKLNEEVFEKENGKDR